MKKLLTYLTLFIISCTTNAHTINRDKENANSNKAYLSAFNKPNPKIAVVLSGGGAKGAAHVGALKVIEDAGIKIDMIVGTSMGAIIGGLYSIGYTPESLDSILMAQDWGTLLSDGKQAKDVSFLARERQDSYIVNFPLDQNDSTITKGSKAGIIEGKNIMNMLQKLTGKYNYYNDFNRLPIPFSCVAVDVTSGKEVVFNSGRLDKAIRASMSIPGAFRPISQGDTLLIDGGILNNYPVDVARRMGADIVIGVDVGEGLLKADRINNLMDMVNQIAGIAEADKRRKNREDTDVYIKVDTKGYNMASFTTDAIDTLIIRGRDAAIKKFNELKLLGEKHGGNKAYLNKRKADFTALASDVHLYDVDEYVYEPFPNDAISFSANFNQEEMASVIMQGYVNLPFTKKPTQIGGTIRLGKRYKFKLNTSTLLRKNMYFDFNYEVGYNELRINDMGKASVSTTFSNNIISADIAKSWRYAKLECGVRFYNYNFKNALVDINEKEPDYLQKMSGSNNYWDFYVNTGVNTTNKKIFATSGVKLEGEINLYKGHDVAVESSHSLYSIRASGNFYFSTSPTFCLIPAFYMRHLDKQSNYYGIYNIIGGEWDGHYLNHQIPFYGISYFERGERAIAIARLQARQRIGKNHYLSAILNTGGNSDGFKNIFKTKFMIGGALNYSYDSIVGPLSATLSTSNITNDVELLLSLGFVF